MERTVPSTASEEVDLYLRTYYSLLRSSAEVQIRTLEEVHAGMNSLLHPFARELAPDSSAFIYSLLRLPDSVASCQVIVLAQSLEVFAQGGYPDVEEWEQVYASARRRKCYFNGNDTLACYIASRSDIDDVIPILTAYQIEWNKFHGFLKRLPSKINLEEVEDDMAMQQNLADFLQITWEDLQRLRAIWREDFTRYLVLMASAPRRFRVLLLNGSLTEYRRATNKWWYNIQSRCPEIETRPVYFISGNNHSLLNMLSGFALRHKEELLPFLDRSENKALKKEWHAIQEGDIPSSVENFLYYLLRKAQGTEGGQGLLEAQVEEECSVGLQRVTAEHSFDIEAQVVDISKLCPEWFDPRLNHEDFDFLKDSSALILNIDYPLGLAAYNILSKISVSSGKVLGVYIMGKAATLNGVIGDVMIPDVIHDEHSKNTYIFHNSFTAADVSPYIVYGTVLDNQKAVTVQGTFLQNARYMDVFYREGYTDIEMEAGPYLSAAFEMFRPTRHPVNEIVNLYGVGFDLGVIHYASDTPLGKGKNLGAGSLSYFGMDSTYAATVAILRRIMKMERNRLSQARSRP
jgi:hypothetical protein